MRRLHPASAAQRILQAAFQAGSTGFFAGFLLTGPLGVGPFWLVFVLAGAGALAGGVHGAVRYYRFTYGVEGDTLAVASGVLNRQQREIPLGRVQNVDVNRSVLQRILGVAVVRFETAGGGGTEAVLNAVSLDEARRLQDLVAAHGRDETQSSIARESSDADIEGHAATATGGFVEPEPDPSLRYELDLRDLLVLGIVSAVPAAPVLVVVTTPVVGDVALSVVSATTSALGGPETVAIDRIAGYSTSDLILVAVVALIEFAVATWLVSAGLTVVQYYGFRLERVDDELRYERGLFARHSGSIPIDKIQTVTIRETAPMRTLGYAALSVETAGYGPGSGGQTTNTAVPLDDRETVVEMAESIGGFEYAEVELPPRRARRRYAVRYASVVLTATGLLWAVDAALFSFAWWYAPLFTLPLAGVAGHLTWHNRGHALTPDAFLSRNGFWRRSTRAVPYYRVQTVVGSRSVFQRYRHLASVTADTASSSSLVGGDATAHDVDDETARRLHEALRCQLDEHVRHRRVR